MPNSATSDPARPRAGHEQAGLDRWARPAGTPVRLYGVVLASLASEGLPDDLPDDLTLTPHRSIAGLTQPAPADQARRVREYLLGYAEILDRVVRAGPVLPVRFGTTLPSQADVVNQVLAPEHDLLHQRLTALAGKAQFMLRAHYHDAVLIREVLARWPEAARLHQHLGRVPAGVADPRRLRLGELVARGVAVQRESDLHLLGQELAGHAVATAPRPVPTSPGDRLGDVAFLVELARGEEFEAAVAEAATRWRERVQLRLLGPMAPYDFVAEALDGLITGRGR